MKAKEKADCSDNGNQDKKNKINSNINNEIVPEKRKRGRPKGSTNKAIRKDHAITTEPGENTKFLRHDLNLYKLPRIDMNDLTQVKQRIEYFFSLCATDDIKPSIEGLALSFGVSRIALFAWINGKNNVIKNVEVINAIKESYNIINSYYAHMMNNGKINPVAGIFLMKNNYGYQDTTQYILSTNTDKQLSIDDISNRAGLLND